METDEILNGPVHADPRYRELCTRQLIEQERLRGKHAAERVRLALDIQREQE